MSTQYDFRLCDALLHAVDRPVLGIRRNLGSLVDHACADVSLLPRVSRETKDVARLITAHCLFMSIAPYPVSRETSRALRSNRLLVSENTKKQVASTAINNHEPRNSLERM